MPSTERQTRACREEIRRTLKAGVGGSGQHDLAEECALEREYINPGRSCLAFDPDQERIERNNMLRLPPSSATH